MPTAAGARSTAAPSTKPTRAATSTSSPGPPGRRRSRISSDGLPRTIRRDQPRQLACLLQQELGPQPCLQIGRDRIVDQRVHERSLLLSVVPDRVTIAEL